MLIRIFYRGSRGSTCVCASSRENLRSPHVYQHPLQFTGNLLQRIGISFKCIFFWDVYSAFKNSRLFKRVPYQASTKSNGPYICFFVYRDLGSPVSILHKKYHAKSLQEHEHLLQRMCTSITHFFSAVFALIIYQSVIKLVAYVTYMHCIMSKSAALHIIYVFSIGSYMYVHIIFIHDICTRTFTYCKQNMKTLCIHTC